MTVNGWFNSPSNDPSRRPGAKKSERNLRVVLKRLYTLLLTYVYVEVSMVVDKTFARRLAKSSRPLLNKRGMLQGEDEF
jgi:hypothetical protein